MKKILSILFICTISLGCSNKKVNVLYGLNQTNSNNVVLMLMNNGISSEKIAQKDGYYDILVPENDLGHALELLQSNGQPKNTFTTLGEVFKKDSFISSPTEEHGRLLYALDQEISAMLSVFNGVVDVKTEVNIPMPNDNLWQGEIQKSSVAVVIKYKLGERVDLYSNRIKNLVSKSVPGVTVDQVEIITIPQKDIF